MWQSVHDKDVAWQMSAKKYYSNARNANSIGIEICMLDKAGNIRQGSIDHAAQLVRVLRHYDVTRKDCPAPMVADTKLRAAGITDGTAPRAPLTREQYAVMQRRAGVIGK